MAALTEQDDKRLGESLLHLKASHFLLQKPNAAVQLNQVLWANSPGLIPVWGGESVLFPTKISAWGRLRSCPRATNMDRP